MKNTHKVAIQPPYKKYTNALQSIVNLVGSNRLQELGSEEIIQHFAAHNDF